MDGAPVGAGSLKQMNGSKERVTKRTTPECRNLLVVSAVYVEELYTT